MFRQCSRVDPRPAKSINVSVRFMNLMVHESLCPCCRAMHQLVQRDGQWVFERHERRVFGYGLRRCENSGKPFTNAIRSHNGVYIQVGNG